MSIDLIPHDARSITVVKIIKLNKYVQGREVIT
jgi:hypothetical protein